VAAIEIGLIWYMGRVVDLLSNGTPAEVLADHGTELILAALFVLLIRPLMQGLDVALLNNAILPQFGTLIRWRAHRQVLRQSVGFFENDFAGRIANRIMQTPLSGGEAVFQIFDAITFALAYLVGAACCCSGPIRACFCRLSLWFALYGLLLRWTILRIGPASKASADARSATTGRIVDSYTNIHAVKLFAHHDREIAYAKEAIETTRRTFAREMRLFTIMDVALTMLNGLSDRGGRGLGRVALGRGCGDRRHGGGGDGADAAAQRHDRMDHVGGVEFLPFPRRRGRRDGDDHRAHHADRREGRQAARLRQGRDRVRRGLAPLRARRRAGWTGSA
jgi:ABC-type multidrug transport system fused ATPase/permease subunit